MTNNQLKFNQTMVNLQEMNRINSSPSALSRVFAKLGEIISPKIYKNSNSGLTVGHVPNSEQISVNEQLEFLKDSLNYLDEEEEDEPVAIEILVHLIEATLRDAKMRELNGVEVLIPEDLTVRVASDIAKLAKDEPCGLRGGTVYLEYSDRVVGLKLGNFRLDHTVPATFDIVVTLRPDQASWLLRPALSVKGYLSKKAKNDLVVVSSGYTLTKNKLYRDNENPESPAK